MQAVAHTVVRWSAWFCSRYNELLLRLMMGPFQLQDCLQLRWQLGRAD